MGSADDPRRAVRASELPDSFGQMEDMSARKLQRSDELAEICRHHHAALVRLLSVRTGSAEEAKEVLQEAYAKVLALDRPGTISLMAGYLWRVAVNLAMDRKRKQALQNRFFRRTRSMQRQEEPSAEATIDSRQRLAIVERAIENLPPRCLEAFVLHVLEGLTFAEVGREMAITEQMSRRHVARALEYLQSSLDAADATGRTR